MHLLLLMLPMVSSCIKTFTPDIRSKDVNKYVITGQITDGDGSQTINISRTAPIAIPQYIPVTKCMVRILDDKGHEFLLSEAGNGDYNTIIDPAYLIPGNSFKLEVITPNGDEINSDFDQMMGCPEVDSVYFIRKDIEGNNPGQFTRGIQLYIDLNGSATNSRNYRWDVVETWEYHTDYPLEWYYDGTFHQVTPPDYSRNVCWSTKKVPAIYTLTTENLTENKYRMLPLHYVSNRTSRLMYGYSVLIRQYALSQAAYIYWDQMRVNSSQEGGLYTTQPLPVKGNLHNLTHPEEEVLGFFGATSLRAKRIFIRKVEGLTLDFSTYCKPSMPQVWIFTPSEYPIYFINSMYGRQVITEECVNCLMLGGINEKPDFWPN